MEYSTTVRAESVEKAIRLGLTKLGITQDEAVVNVISEGKKGLFGFGKQDAIVEISKNVAPSLSELTIDSSTIVEKIDDEVIVDDQESSHIIVNSDENIELEQSSSQLVLEEEVKQDQADEMALLDSESSTNESDNALNESNVLMEEYERVARYLENVIREYGADAVITVEKTSHQVAFNINTEKSGLIIGKHGKIINSLQVLAQVMVHQFDKRRQSIILNIGDYRDRRAGVLEQIAQRTAKEVLRTKRSMILDPLPSYERKQIHAYLSKIDHIETHSEGRDPNRYLVVEYKA